MSTVVIVVIVVVVLAIVAVMVAAASKRKREKQLGQAQDRALHDDVDHHREQAESARSDG